MEIKKNYRKTQLACYLGFVTQAICANFVPLLFITFHNAYDISFGMLALISSCFFVTQLIVDFMCAGIVDKLGYRICIIAAEITSGLGLAGLAFLPDLLPVPFHGILACVIIYAIGSGLTEVLCSPIIEACPFENKASMMSLLHSFYCWGWVGVVLCSTIFFTVFGIEHWRIMALTWSVIPFYNIYNFATCPIEPLIADGKSMTMLELIKTKTFWIFIVLMVCAGSSEIAMGQWASAFANITLTTLTEDDRENFILENQRAFRFGAMEEFGLRDDHCEEGDEIISRETIERSIDEGVAYRIRCDGEIVGGLVLKIDEEMQHNHLELLFVSPNAHSKGIGLAAWREVERLYPETEVWETCTPYFETRNIHFYVNKCGFHIVEFFNSHHPDPLGPDTGEEESRGSEGGMFRFEKRMNVRGATNG